jgi:IS605 OrfB family transposase
MANYLGEYIKRSQSRYGFSIKSLAIEPDHVHLLFTTSSSEIDLNKIVQGIKGFSSKMLRKKFPKLMVYKALWTPSHFLATSGDVSSQTILNYINAQGVKEEEVVQRTLVFKVLDPTTKKGSLLNRWLGNPESRPKALVQSWFRGNKSKDQISLRNDVIKVLDSSVKSAKYWLFIGGGNGSKPIKLGLNGQTIEGKVKDSFLIKRGSSWYAHLVVEQQVFITESHQNILAVDLGINHPITAVLTRNNKPWDTVYLGSEIKRINYVRSKRLTKLQRHSKENIKQRLAKSTRSKKDFIHKYTKRLVNFAKSNNATIVVGNIHNISKSWDKACKKRNKTFRKKAKSTPYGAIMSQLFYKGTLNGVQVAFQDEHYTSQTCSHCGVLGVRSGNNFSCSCGYKNQADRNGAINIALAYRLSRDGTALVPEGSLLNRLPKEPLVSLGDLPL